MTGWTKSWEGDRALRDDADVDDVEQPPAPFLRWAGSKRWIADTIAAQVAARAPRRYIEPFLGSGAVALAVSSTPTIVIDACAPLMGVWWWIKKDAVRLAEAIPPAFDNVEDRYYAHREAFNARRFSTTDPLPAALFVWLNHTCFNGLYRENRDGAFNVPWGKRRTIRLPTPAQLERIARHLARAQILLGGDFEHAIKLARGGDVIYADPPYDATFTDYNAGGFTADDQARLAAALRGAVDRGAAVITTNSDTPRVRELYAGWTLEPLAEPRRVGGKNASREDAPCLLISSP